MTKKIFRKGSKLLSVILVIMMLLTSIPMSAIAVTTDDGFIEVSTIEDLYNIRLDLTANYRLMNDIDLTEATAKGGDWDFGGRGWNPIGSEDIYSDSAFSGIFDGNGYAIIGMRINYTSSNDPSGMGVNAYVGLFAKVTGEICNLEMKDANIIGAYANSDLYVGAIAGRNSGVITDCSVSGQVVEDLYGDYVGAVAGYNTGTISKCYNVADVTGYKYAGGIVGYNEGAIENSYNTGAVFAELYTSGNYGYAGGIAANNSGKGSANLATITNCYNMGAISAGFSNYAYAIAYKSSYSKTVNAYYLSGTGIGSTGATSLTDAQMKLQSMYTGFDFENTWVLNSNAVFGYPQLKSNIQDDRDIKEAKIATLPDKTVFVKEQELDLTGCTLQFTYTNADTEIVNVTNSMVTGYDKNTVGEQVLTITHNFRTFELTITVEEKPFTEIYTVTDLYNIRYDLNSNYRLMNDIDLTEATAKGGDWDFGGRGWNPIGSEDVYSNSAFSGIFDGNGHAIIGMRINYTSSNDPSGMGVNAYVGLFAEVTGEIRNLEMKDTNILGAYASTDLYVGAIAGRNSGVITDCSVSGQVVEDLYGDYVGAVAGYNTGTISKCYNVADITGYENAGGIVGYNKGAIENCYNTGAVSAELYTSGNYGYAGGIAAYNYGKSSSTATITNCYNMGAISAGASNYAYAIAYNSAYGKTVNSYYLSGTGISSTGATSLTDVQMKLSEMYTGFDFDNTWVLNANANYPYAQLQSNPQDLNETVATVSVIAYPVKLDYLTGDELNTVGGMIQVVYVSGKTEVMGITADMITGYDPEQTGEQTLTVTFGEASDTYSINVTKRPDVTGVELISEPAQTEFVVGTAFDFSGAKIKVTYDNNTSEVLDVTEDMTTGGDINHMSTQTITVTVGGYSDSFTVKVIAATIYGIEITELPDKLEYAEGEQLDTTGMKVNAIYTNGMEVEISSGYTVSGYSSEPGTHTVTVGFVGKTATFTVTVAEKELLSIIIQANPDKTEYIVGEKLDLEGLLVVAVYGNGTREIVEDYQVSGFDSTAGIKVITVTYGEKTASFTVTVTVKTVTGIRIVSKPAKLNYIENESLNTSGLVVEAAYNDGTTANITDYEVVGFSSNPGVHTISVVYEGFVQTFEVSVTARTLVDLKITAPDKIAYYIGEEFDATGLVVTACYNNGLEIAVDDYQLSGYDSTSAGTKTITVTYANVSRSFAVAVAERSVVVTDGHVIVGSAVGRLGEDVVIPVSVTKNTGISGFCHTITFDTSDLEFVSAKMVGKYADGTVVVNDENIDNGELVILWFGTTDVKDNDTVYNLTFKVLETAADGKSDVCVDFEGNSHGNVSGENVLFEAVNGYVDVRSYWLGDLNSDRKYTMADLLTLAQVVAKMDITLTASQKLAADVNEDTVIDIHDVIMLQQWLLAADI